MRRGGVFFILRIENYFLRVCLLLSLLFAFHELKKYIKNKFSSILSFFESELFLSLKLEIYWIHLSYLSLPLGKLFPSQRQVKNHQYKASSINIIIHNVNNKYWNVVLLLLILFTYVYSS